MNSICPSMTSAQDLPSGDFALTLAPPVAHHTIDWGDLFIEGQNPSILIFADEEASRSGFEHLAVHADYRILGSASLADASMRLSTIIDVDVILLACRGDEPGLDIVLARLDMISANNGTMLCIITDFAGLDAVHAIVDSPRSIILCDPNTAELISTMTLMAQNFYCDDRLRDSGKNEDGHYPEADRRIDKLTDDLDRLTRTIEALVQNRMLGHFPPMSETQSGTIAVQSPERTYSSFPNASRGNASTLTAQQVRAVLRARRLRDQILSGDLFADPAWDILLDLMAAHLENTRVSVSSLCIAAAVPPTTALRWIRQLTERGLLMRQADPEDGRRIFIALSEQGVKAVQRWFEESRSLFISAAG